ncbi:MAG: Coenzyme F420 hydrogenase/dehydrogenase, beta subunit C-terminal domain [Actinobacteria bacterium]|nr:Coenzyme F420 hydrogenase/dehydrogenase, beta subunit C-terminal domain [Actinomycetota bacterium]
MYKISRKKSKGKVRNVNFRDKIKYGWLRPCIRVDYDSGESNYYIAADDPYERIYLSGIALRESCYNCKLAKPKRIGDLTIGDFWGVEKLYPEISNHKGLSVLTINIDKCEILFKSINSFEICKKTNLSLASQNNETLIRPTIRDERRSYFYKDLLNYELDKIVNILD